MEQNLPRIGIFDSGIGGLSILLPCLELLPPATYFYYGDNARAPYGNRSEGEITGFVREAFKVLEGEGVDVAVIACNTATAVCADQMRREFPFPILGMEPAVKQAAVSCRNVIVLATPRTAESARLKNLIMQFPECHFTVFPAANLAAAIEGHFLHGEPLSLDRHLPQNISFDGAVLGCTHYSLIREEIARFWGIQLFDGTEGTVRHLAGLLNLGIENHLNPQSLDILYLREKWSNFRKNRVIFLGSGRLSNKRFIYSNICFRKK